MKSNYQMKLVGLLFLIGGVCFLGEQLEVWEFSIFFPGWWTIFLLLPALFSMFDNGVHFGNTACMAIGIYLLLDANEWIHVHLTFGAIVALICILVGIKIIVGERGHHTKRESNRSSDIHTSVFFGNKRMQAQGLVNSLDVQCMMGTQYIDLSEADIRNMEFLNLNCVFGTIDLIVPSEMNFVIKKDTILGSCNVSDVPVGKYDLYVDISCVLGQVNLRKKRNEQFYEGEFKEK